MRLRARNSHWPSSGRLLGLFVGMLLWLMLGGPARAAPVFIPPGTEPAALELLSPLKLGSEMGDGWHLADRKNRATIP